jgi:GNAT superfamily N-acetyltransferase
MWQIQAITPEDIGDLYELICRAADESAGRNAVQTTPEDLLHDAFSEHPRFESLIARNNSGDAIGFTLYYPLYSGWKGTRTLYMEDLFVVPEYREQGLGHSLFQAMARISWKSEMNLSWEVSRDDFSLRQHYTEMGAIDRSHKINYYASGDVLKNIAGM